MTKRILDPTEYTFDASAKTLTFPNGIILRHLLLVTNLSSNDIIYNFACDGFGGTILGNILTLEYDTTSMADADNLSVIIYEEDKGVESNQLLDIIANQTEVLDECLVELQKCSKYLRKIYNPK